jgi:type II secretion system protein G
MHGTNETTDRAPAFAARAARGFSLLELTLVLVIIGLLMGVAAVNIIGAAERAKERTTRASMATIKSQLQAYNVEKSTLTETLPVLVTENYIDENNLTDGWNRAFYYRPLPEGQGQFELISAGKDGDFETFEDNIDAQNLTEE